MEGRRIEQMTVKVNLALVASSAVQIFQQDDVPFEFARAIQ